jgi:hypothetical protein
MNIEANQEQFLEDMTVLKNDLIKSLNSENVEKYRGEYKGRYSPERFKEFFIEKTVLHIIFKYVLIRMIEESMARVRVKLNEKGMENWKEMSKNFREDYNLLLEFAESDVKREKDLAEIFKDSIFDESQFISKTKNVTNNHIPTLAKYDFSDLNANTTITLIDTLYNSEKRDELQDFYQQSHVINFLLQQVGLM